MFSLGWASALASSLALQSPSSVSTGALPSMGLRIRTSLGSEGSGTQQCTSLAPQQRTWRAWWAAKWQRRGGGARPNLRVDSQVQEAAEDDLVCLSPLSQFFCNVNNPPDIYANMTLEGYCSVEELVAPMQLMADLHDRFRRRLVYRFGAWKAEVLHAFDVRTLMREVTLEGPDAQQAYHDYMGRLMTHEPLGTDGLPPWDVVCIHYACDPGRTDVLMRASHIIGDGQLFMKLIKQIMEPLDATAAADYTRSILDAPPGTLGVGVPPRRPAICSAGGGAALSHDSSLSSSSSGGEATAAAGEGEGDTPVLRRPPRRSSSSSSGNGSSDSLGGSSDQLETSSSGSDGSSSGSSSEGGSAGGGLRRLLLGGRRQRQQPQQPQQQRECVGHAAGARGLQHQQQRQGRRMPKWLRALGSLARMLWNQWTALLFSYIMLLGPSDPVTMVKASPAQCAGPRRWGSVTISLPEFHRVARALGASLNTLAVSCLAGGLRRYLLRGGAAPARRVRLCGMVDTRSMPAGGLGALLLGGGSSSNNFSFIGVPLFTGEAAPLARLARVGGALSWVRHSLVVPIAIQMPRLIQFVFRAPAWSSWAILRAMPLKTTVGFSNMRGPAGSWSLAGYRVTRIHNGVQPMAFGSFISLFSYDAGLTLTHTCFESKTDAPQVLLECMLEEYQVLRKAASVTPDGCLSDPGSPTDTVKIKAA